MSELTGILGWPLEHTLSPHMHNAAFRHAGLDWIYLAWSVPPEQLGAAVGGFRALGIRGANVTMPHKEKVIEYLDDISGDARTTGAVNTIQEIGGRLVGHNTDVDGFRTFIEADSGFDVAGRSAVVLGAGGAARAVVWALDGLGIGTTTVVSRDLGRAEAVAGLSAVASAASWSRAEELAANADVLVNATPLGGAGEDPVPDAEIHSGSLVVDLIYQPPSTPLVERARRAGAQSWGGIGMLVHQAVAAWRIWTGREPPVEVMSAAAVHALGLHRLED